MQSFDSLLATIQQLRRLCQWDCQTQWHLLPDAPWRCDAWQDYPLGTVNDKGYHVWEKGEQVQWFAQRITVPTVSDGGYSLTGLTLRLALTWWAVDAQIFVGTEQAQAGDLFDSKCRLLLSDYAQPGDSWTVALRLVSPGHDIGGLMASRLVFERPSPQQDPGFVADELEVLCRYLQDFQPEALPFVQAELNQIAWPQVGDARFFDDALAQIRQRLLPLTPGLKTQQLNLLGHAHLDMAWLWPLSETWEVGERTFRSVIQLQQEFPDLVFGHTSPALYDWIEQHRPALFQQIQTAVVSGCWELLGGMWIEPDVMLSGGESLVRQLLYGQRYFQSRFGQRSRVAWLPDSFGFCRQLPQLFRQAGIDYFVTGKLHWNDTNSFPLGAFYWQSPDGTTLFTVMSPPNVAGIMDNQPLPMADYARRWQQQTGATACLWLPGVGDHGGGPTCDMWQMYHRWQISEFFPALRSQPAIETIPLIEQQVCEQSQPCPEWDQDLYLELHRGCYTTHAEQKRFNRHCEHLLYEAELWSSFACWSDGGVYPQQPLEAAWKKVLLNQFHDILPGTSIPEVFVTANQDWHAVKEIALSTIQTALERLVARTQLPSPPTPDARPIWVFNPLNWPQSQVVSLSPKDIQESSDYAIQAWDATTPQPLQGTPEGSGLFVASVPSLTYRGYWLITNSGNQSTPERAASIPKVLILDNGWLRVTVDPQTGNLLSVYDLRHQQECLAAPGNVLQFFQDQGQYWDAWNIDPDYEQHPLPAAQLAEWQWLEWGPVRWRLRVIRTFQHSRFQQDYCLTLDSPMLSIETQVDWQETHVLAKTAFPLTLHSDHFTTEMPCAVNTYPTRPDTELERAKWEVPHHHWVDLSDDQQHYGVSVLNDGKYGCDVKDNQIRLTLLRSSVWPDPQSDRGHHQFTYQLYPHSGTWQTAKTVQQGYALNRPLRVYFPTTKTVSTPDPQVLTLPQILPPQPWLTLGCDHVVLMVVKQQEDSTQHWAIRWYECEGQPGQVEVETIWAHDVMANCTLLEELTPQDNAIGPWSITSQCLISPHV